MVVCVSSHTINKPLLQQSTLLKAYPGVSERDGHVIFYYPQGSWPWPDTNDNLYIKKILGQTTKTFHWFDIFFLLFFNCRKETIHHSLISIPKGHIVTRGEIKILVTMYVLFETVIQYKFPLFFFFYKQDIHVHINHALFWILSVIWTHLAENSLAVESRQRKQM